MIPRPFELHSPSTVSEAISLLKSMEDAKVLAGGQSLVPLMKLRLVSPANLVDLGRIRGLSYIKEGKGHLLIGAMTTHNDVASSPSLMKKCAMLSETARQIGDNQVRNRGTIGGTISHADPAGDIPAAVLALDAELKVAGPRRTRVIIAKDFFEDILTTSLRRDEILIEVKVPVLPPRSGGAYLKLGRGASDLATVGVAAVITLDQAGACKDARLGLAGVGSTPIRATKAEDALKGKTLSDDLLAKAGDRASEMSNPSSDIRGSAEYKREMVKVYVRRAIRQSLARI
ncbi:MAG TPA: xanthine dehydrogenase family protein subunit M [Nitrososphaerales archaeon]|nr:xanthine dehydrogenase family protein subunit M [Nitrososphaerales archaeon]